MTEDQLLKVLDMSEEEQVEFFYIKGYRQLVDTFPAGGLRIKYNKNNEIISVKHSQSKLRFDRLTLADLAFRLRDEVKDLTHKDPEWGDINSLYKAQKSIYEKITGEIAFVPQLAEWWVMEAKPIHWIISALIAKLPKCEMCGGKKKIFPESIEQNDEGTTHYPPPYDCPNCTSAFKNPVKGLKLTLYPIKPLSNSEWAKKTRDRWEKLAPHTNSTLDYAISALFEACDRIDEADVEKDLAIAHDRQPYPTAEAYEKVCAILKERDKEIEKLIEGQKAKTKAGS